MNAARSRIASAGGMTAHLLVLELEQIPRNLGDLQNQYVRLLKHYHPDKNGERKQWAHEKTTRLIQSYRSLRDYIIHRAPRSGETARKPNRTGAVRPETGTGGTAPRTPRGDFANFQLINGDDTNYAVPVELIETIVSTRLSRFHRHSTGCYCEYGDRILNVVPLRDGTDAMDEIDYVVLMKGPDGTFGIGVPASMKFGTIEKIALCELVHMGKGNRGARWLRYQSRTYLVPEIVHLPGVS